jgi:hypothetical protein
MMQGRPHLRVIESVALRPHMDGGSRASQSVRTLVSVGAILMLAGCSPEDPGGRARLDGGSPNGRAQDGALAYTDGYASHAESERDGRPFDAQDTADDAASSSRDARRPASDGAESRPDAGSPAPDATPVPDSAPPAPDAAPLPDSSPPPPDAAPIPDSAPTCDPAPPAPQCKTGLVREARIDAQTDCIIGWRCVCPPPEQATPPSCNVGRPERVENQAGCLLRYACRCPTAPAKPVCYFDLQPRYDDDRCVVGWSCLEPPVCRIKEASNLPRNPGCDPDVIRYGFSAIGRINDGEIYFTRGNKLWALTTTSGGTFSAGVADLAGFLRGFATKADVQNPGLHSPIRASGLDSLGMVTIADQRLVYLTKGTHWWSFDLDESAFVANGSSLSTALGAFTPPAGDPCPALNPGCNAQVRQRGLSAIEFVPGESGNLWLLLQGPNYWIYNDFEQSFVQQGNIADYFLRFAPAGQNACSTARFPDGTYRNPGCLSQIRSSGPAAIGEIEFLGKTGWLITWGTTYWHLDSSLTFVEGGKDLAAFLRRVPTRSGP